MTGAELQGLSLLSCIMIRIGTAGWAIPKQPPFIPAGWTGDPAKQPYPEYIHAINTTQPQVFPEKGDLVKAWSFGGKSYNP